MPTAQEEFDNKYITSREVCETLGINRSDLFFGRNAGRMPDAIVINRPNGTPHVTFWLRDIAMPYIQRWKAELAA